MNENRDNHSPMGFLCLLIYQGALVLYSLGYMIVVLVELLNTLNTAFLLSVAVELWHTLNTDLSVAGEVLVVACVHVVLAGWTAAMIYASVEMVRRRPRGFLVGMICHLLLEVVGWLFVLFLVGFWLYVQASTSDNSSRGFADLYLLFAFMWLPLLLLSLWAYFYLRRRRASLLA